MTISIDQRSNNIGAPSNTGNILVVDDEQDILTVVTKVLQNAGFNASGFTDPVNALEHFRLHFEMYVLLMSDIHMPRMSGYEFAQRIKQIKSDVKIILITASELDDYERSVVIRSLGIVQVVKKPMRLTELIQTVTKHITNLN
jgi:two-component system, cell cycle response regulator CpdR